MKKLSVVVLVLSLVSMVTYGQSCRNDGDDRVIEGKDNWYADGGEIRVEGGDGNAEVGGSIILKPGNGHMGAGNIIMDLSPNSYVGIGTDDPSSDLDIGNGTLEWDNGGGKLISDWRAISWNRQEFRIALDANNDQTDAAFVLSNNGFYNEKVRFHLDGGISYINTGGNVGIGTSSPDALLHLGSNTTGANRIRLSKSGSGPHGIDFMNSDNTLGMSIYYQTDYEGLFIEEGFFGGKLVTILPYNGNVGIGTTSPAEKLHVNGNSIISGKLGIGTTSPDYKLDVNGTIRAKEIKVETGWSDFVFADNYQLMPLDKLADYIKTNKSLPGITKEKEVVKEGVNLGDMQAKLLEKVEELTLYVINQNKELTELKKENEELKERISALEK